jgi:hypothetical protein
MRQLVGFVTSMQKKTPKSRLDNVVGVDPAAHAWTQATARKGHQPRNIPVEDCGGGFTVARLQPLRQLVGLMQWHETRAAHQ